MQIPFAGFAVDPGHRLLFQLRNEVVALRLVAVPPARLDALGTGEQRELAVAQPARRLQQPQRARAGLPELARLPFARLDAAPGELGAVVRIEREAVHGAVPEARLEALEEP